MRFRFINFLATLIAVTTGLIALLGYFAGQGVLQLDATFVRDGI